MKQHKSLVFIIWLCALILLGGSFAIGQGTGLQPVKICVVADIHYFHSSLLIQDGPAFQEYVSNDRKLLAESAAITESLIDSLIAEEADIVIVTGDITKDGEYVCHQQMAAYFAELEQAGTQVYVTPGNHDINNPNALAFIGDTVMEVPGTDPNQFKYLYSNYGYNQAIALDTASLSYVAEPIPGIQIISMDACRYDENYLIGFPESSGGFMPQVLQWIKDRLMEARAQNKIVIGFMHHNILEHFDGQKDLFTQYVIDDFDTISNQFADLGMKVVLTGHFHAQDMIMKVSPGGNPIYDIETGSPVTYPCPYRILELTSDTLLEITGKRIVSINYNTDSLTFQEYAKNFLEAGLPQTIMYILSQPPYSIDSAFVTIMTPPTVESIAAHLEGNEGTPSIATLLAINMLKLHPTYGYAGYALESIWDDALPDDWTVSIDLRDTMSTIGITSSINLSSFKVFPVPAKDELTITIHENIPGRTTVQLFDLYGKQVKNSEVEEMQMVNFDVSDLIPGSYVLRIRISDIVMSRIIIVVPY